jgi:hypothetical protein
MPFGLQELTYAAVLVALTGLEVFEVRDGVVALTARDATSGWENNPC